jgi:hypothetical protein
MPEEGRPSAVFEGDRLKMLLAQAREKRAGHRVTVEGPQSPRGAVDLGPVRRV